MHSNTAAQALTAQRKARTICVVLLLFSSLSPAPLCACVLTLEGEFCTLAKVDGKRAHDKSLTFCLGSIILLQGQCWGVEKERNVKTKMPLRTEVQIKSDFDMCGSTCLLSLFSFSQNYDCTFMNFSARLQTFELDFVLFTGVRALAGWFHRVVSALDLLGSEAVLYNFTPLQNHPYIDLLSNTTQTHT